VTRLLSAILVVSLLLSSAGCGGFFRGTARTGSTLQGSVDIVQLGNVVDGTGDTIQVTFVTFLQDGVPFTIDFCDDQTDLFPLEQIVLVDFNPGLTCANVILVELVF
jgi:hypothetical protein